MRSVPAPETRPHLLIADDHALFADALWAYLAEKNYNVVGSVPDGHSLVTETVRLKPDVVIADALLPLMNGLDAARKIKPQAPKVRFLFLTEGEDLNFAAAAQELAPVGFLRKQSRAEELLTALRSVLHRRTYVSPKLRMMDWAETRMRAEQCSKEMTSRQRDVIKLLAEGRPLKEVAALLDISQKTVEFHKHRLMDTFNLKNNTHLVLFALRRGLIRADL